MTTWDRCCFGLLAPLLALAACAPEADPEDALRAAFGEKAQRVLEAQHSFQPESGGFVAEAGAIPAWAGPERPRRGALGASLPRKAEEAIELQLPSGRKISVRERGVFGDADVAEQTVAYRRDGGVSFWKLTEAGVEEWILLDGLPESGEAGSWEVRGLRLQQHGSAVDLYDDAGVAQVTVSAPAAYRGDGQPVPVRLVAKGNMVVAEVQAAVGERVLVDPVWVPAGSMAEERAWHSGTRLMDGRVLVAGGTQKQWNVKLDSAELYDPATTTWSPAAPMAQTRVVHASVLLPDGRVLVVGGTTGDSIGKSVELYDTATDTWSQVASTNAARGMATATLLPDGRVLVVGGLESTNPGAEIYNPSAGTWTFTAPMIALRDYHTASLLPNSTVLVTGGIGSYMHSAELYDIAADVWLPAAPMIVNRFGHAATVLPDGDVLVTGGSLDGTESVSSTERYDSVVQSWTSAGAMADGRYGHGSTLLENGHVLVIGGQGEFSVLRSTESYDGTTWTNGPSLDQKRATFSLVTLLDGSILASGGWTATAERYFTDFLPLGAHCGTKWAACKSGFCRQGICCNENCKTNECSTCLAVEGAPQDGICTKFSGRPCEADGNFCTENDHCEDGECIASPEKICWDPMPCYFTNDLCRPWSGECGPPSTKPDGVDCPGGTCRSGVCKPDSTSTGGNDLSAEGGGGCSCEVLGGSGTRGRGDGAAFLILMLFAARRHVSRKTQRDSVG